MTAQEERAAERDVFEASERGDLRVLRDAMRVVARCSAHGTRAVANRAHPSTGLTPLHAAAARGFLHIVEALVTDFGADASRTAGSSSLLEQPVHFAARNGHLACVAFFVSGGHATVDEPTRDWPLLHVAAVAGHAHVVRWLLANGADVHRRGVMGRTAVTRAAFCRHHEGGTATAVALLHGGADPNAGDAAGDYPCVVAARRGNHETLRALLASGADVQLSASASASASAVGPVRPVTDRPTVTDRRGAVGGAPAEAEEEARSLLRAAAAAEDRSARAVEVLLRHFAAEAEGEANEREHGDGDGDGDGVEPPLSTALLSALPSWLFFSEQDSDGTCPRDERGTPPEDDSRRCRARYRSREGVDGGDQGTALHVAAKFGNLEALELLLRAEAAASTSLHRRQRADARRAETSSSSFSSLSSSAAFLAILDAHGRTAADVAADDACRIVAAGQPW